jgi:transcription factor MBP1
VDAYHPEADAYREISRDASPDSFMQDDTYLNMSQNSAASRKRKRDLEPEPPSDIEHTIYGDELLDYFVAAGDDAQSNLLAPKPPANFDVNRPIDQQGNNALHWACAMGDVQVTRDLLGRGANPAAQNHGSAETPLIRAVLFTNNYDKRTFPKIVDLLAHTIVERDAYGATVFHHIAETGRSRGKWSCARYYSEVLINKMQDMGPSYIHALLTSVDANHDTAALCAIRNGCVKVATFLLNHCPEAGDIQNLKGETANDHLRALREKRESLEQPGSSPPFGNGIHRKNRRKSGHPPSKQPVSRAASSMYDSANSIFESQRDRLADLYDAEAKEKESTLIEAKTALAEFESQRHKIRQETYAILADPTINESAEDPPHIQALRTEYDTVRRETESLLERSEHAKLQAEVRAEDERRPAHLFRAAVNGNNNAPPNGTTPTLTSDLPTPQETQDSLPWAIELSHQQSRRRQLVRDIASLHGDANSGERINKHRKLVAMATGIKEDELDAMADELLESLQATAAENGGDEVVRDGRGVTLSPPIVVGAGSVGVVDVSG